jgi:hypothetical protein
MTWTHSILDDEKHFPQKIGQFLVSACWSSADGGQESSSPRHSPIPPRRSYVGCSEYTLISTTSTLIRSAHWVLKVRPFLLRKEDKLTGQLI